MDSSENLHRDRSLVSRCHCKEYQHRIRDVRGHWQHHVLCKDRIQRRGLRPILLVEREDLVLHRFLRNALL